MTGVCLVHHRSIPPFKPLRTLPMAANIDRVRPLDEPGTMSFELSLTDLPFANVDSPALQEGSVIIDRSTEGIAPWLWYVTRIEEGIGEGTAEVECEEWRGILYKREVPPDVRVSSRSPVQVAIQLLRASGARNPNHIIPSPNSGTVLPAGSLPTEPLSLGGQSLGGAFDLLAEQTDSEWWLDYRVRWTRIEPVLRWGYRRGYDRTQQVQLSEGYHLAAGAYTRDVAGAIQLARTVGGGGDVSGRAAGAVAVGASVAGFRPIEGGGRTDQSSELQRRKGLVREGSAATKEEAVAIQPSTLDRVSLTRSSVSAMAKPRSALEQIAATVRAETLAWTRFDVGDTIMVRFTSAKFGRGTDAVVRIIAMQPDEAAGEMELALEVQG